MGPIKGIALLSVLACCLGYGQSIEVARNPGGMVLGPDAVSGPVVVTGQNVTVKGPVNGDLLITDGSVRFDLGGSVSGALVVVRGEVSNLVGAPIGKISVGANPPQDYARLMAESPKDQFDYRGWIGLMALWGAVSFILSSITYVLARRRSEVARSAVAQAPWRTALFGLGSAGVVGLLTIVNLLLCRTGIWLPIGIALFVAAGLASLGALWLGYGAGLEQFGSGVLRRLGRPYAGAIASRAAGAGTLTVLKCIPILGFAVVLFEVGMALSGFGASVETGFGTSRGWLASRMRPQTDPSL